MARHRVSPVTVQSAVQRLAAQGLIHVRPGEGSFIAARTTSQRRPPDLSWQSVALGDARPGEGALATLLALPHPGAIQLSTGYFDPSLQPVGALTTALTRAARRPTAWGRQPVEGLAELREWFAREVGGGMTAGDLTICSGGQPALASAFRGFGTPGEVLLVEAPTYLGAIAAGRDAGLRVVGVPVDAEGVRPDLLEAAFARTGARLFYCQPLHANPHGAVLSAARRAEVLRVVADAGAFLIEDDWSRGLTLDGVAPPPLAVDDPDGHVVYLRSLTKVIAPGLRVAAIGARGVAGARLRTARLLDDFFVAGPLQQAAVDFLAAPAWRRHLSGLRTELRLRRDALLRAIERHLPGRRPAVVPTGGLHLWLPLPEGTDEAELVRAAAARGVVVFPGRPWFPAEPPAPQLRLSWGGIRAAEFDEGVRRLADALHAEKG